MREVILLTILCCISFVALVASFAYFNKNKTGVKSKIPLLAFLVFIIVLGFSAYRFFYKGYRFINSTVKTVHRDSNSIYKSIFGKEALGCVTVLNSQDQLVPKIDDAIYLHCYTCSEEVMRITKRYSYTVEKMASSKVDTAASCSWYKPQLLGDSILFLQTTIAEGQHWQYIYLSTDSTEMYFRDVAD